MDGIKLVKEKYRENCLSQREITKKVKNF